ncbi:GntR family transcriptional regulator [Streptomyces palmae]|uniref:GntR family transcriptional regulator n=1 Tax=Streptomyces palmae TaxID=1701085 RepID=A0A4Z0GWA8_9ACTN|nr:GntR family transcriptional regulator [Streptomyces palmae]TGB01563.1 GntR family transcriptional regulator [Streptomyces palmae]
MRGYRQLAEHLRQQINRGDYPPGSTLPRIIDLMAVHSLSRQTVREAIGVLADEGLVVTMGKGGTQVRNRLRVRIPLSRYSRVLRPGGTKGPWESACAQQGLDGRMKVVDVSRGQGPEGVAALLDAPEDAELLHRCRHATIGPDDVVQIQRAWYLADLADEVGISGEGKVVGGVFAAFAAAGHPPAKASERVESRMPSPSEAAQLRIGGKVPVIAVERVTRDREGRALEVLRSVAPADRVQLIYDDLPLNT